MKHLFVALNGALTFDISLDRLPFVIPLEALMHDRDGHAHR